MELPLELKQLVENAAAGVPQKELAAAAEMLSERYRKQSGTGKRLLSRDVEAIAYSVVRMPATYGAVFSALNAAVADGDKFENMLDVGAGTGAAAWAAIACMDGLKNITCLEREPAMIKAGSSYMNQSAAFDGVNVEWVPADMTAFKPGAKYDIVIASYMMNELSPDAREKLLNQLWSVTGKMLLITEPGTPVGFEQIKHARKTLLADGAHVAAPCPCECDCPLPADDWCHFTCRVARTKLHKTLKGGSAPYEDEKFVYIALTRQPHAHCSARVRRHPIIEPGRITLELCAGNGLVKKIVTKKDGSLFKTARKADCGDAIDS